jgi:signal transduction histidine kinase
MSDSSPNAPRPCSPPAANADFGELISGLQSELVACQRLALLGNMSAMIAHEFNNLLTPIIARCEAALTGAPDLPFMRKALERSLTQAQRALQVSRHLLASAHDGAPPGDTCAVAEAVQDAIETMTRPFEKDGISLLVQVPAELRVRARLDLLCQVLLNLLLNSRRAMQDRSGPLTITARVVGACAQIDVCDSGVGIAADQLATRINPFLASDPRARPNDWQQVGLGLSVCRLIAHDHGARLEALANPDRGCTFRLRWPLAGSERATGRC